MRVIVPGHRYELNHFEDNDAKQVIQFIHKEPLATDPAMLETINDGTTNEELMACLIDRMKFLNAKFPCRENSITITKLEEALMWQEMRTRDRVKRQVEGTHQK